MQEELATLSTQSTRIVAEESGHFIHLDQPDLVVEAIRSLIETVRRQQLLWRQGGGAGNPATPGR
jgi:CII-binding regulator of phage lambda lysogenization HflD